MSETKGARAREARYGSRSGKKESMKKVAKEGEGWGWGVTGAGCSMNKRVRARGCWRIRMVEPNGGRAGRRGRG